ncbi:MAG: hypothetical protein ACFFEF_02015 [Candidatus Thorarchaeota archaeon]
MGISAKANKFILVSLTFAIILGGMTFSNLPGATAPSGRQVINGVIYDFSDYKSLTKEQLAIFNYFNDFVVGSSYNDFEGWNANRYRGTLHYMLAFTSYVFESMFEVTSGYRTEQYRNFVYSLIKSMNTTNAEYGNDSIEHIEWDNYQFRDYYYPNATHPNEDDLYTGGFRGPANIMWTGHYALMMLLYERNFHTSEMTDEVTWFIEDWNNSLTTDGFSNPKEGGIWGAGLIPCEPYIVFAQCNSIPIFTTELYDNLYNESWMETGLWDFGLDFIESEMTDEHGLFIDGYFVQEPMGLTPFPETQPQQYPGPALNRQLGLPRVNGYGLAWALTFLEYTIPDKIIPRYSDFIDIYGKDLSNDVMYMMGSYRNPSVFGDVNGMLANVFTTVLANQRGDYATRDRVLNFLQDLYNKVWSQDGRMMHYDTSSLEPFLAPVVGGFSVWSTLPVTVKEMASARPSEFWDYPYISAADDEKIWVYQAEWDAEKDAFILNIQVDEHATLTFSNFDETPTAYAAGISLGDLVAVGSNYILTLNPGTYQLVIM